MQSYFFFLKSFGLSLISDICVEAEADYAAMSLSNCSCIFSSNILFALRHAFQGFTLCNVLLLLLGLFSILLGLFFDKLIVFMYA